MLTAERVREVLSYHPETGQFSWLVSRGSRTAGATAGSLDSEGYVIIRVDRQNYRANRLAWLFMTGEWPSSEVDHQDLHKANNRWGNLREATGSQNVANTSARRAGLKGAYPSGRGWTSFITVNYKRHYLGFHPTELRAHQAYLAAAKHHFGEFARA